MQRAMQALRMRCLVIILAARNRRWRVIAVVSLGHFLDIRPLLTPTIRWAILVGFLLSHRSAPNFMFSCAIMSVLFERRMILFLIPDEEEGQNLRLHPRF
jgi:hypothetical protein